MKKKELEARIKALEQNDNNPISNSWGTVVDKFKELEARIGQAHSNVNRILQRVERLETTLRERDRKKLPSKAPKK